MNKTCYAPKASESLSPCDGLDEIVKSLRRKKPKLRQYSLAYYSRRQVLLEAVARVLDMNDICRRLGDKDDDDDDSSEGASSEYWSAEYVIITEYYPTADFYLMMCFVRDDEKSKKKFEDDIMNIDVYYDVGTYNLETVPRLHLSPVKLTREEETPILNDRMEEVISKDLDDFFSSRKLYDDNKLCYKRGALLYGSPGNGKTSLIRSLLKKNPDKFAITVECSKDFPRTISSFLNIVCGKEPKIIVLEDIDRIEPYNMSSLLNFLDGIDSIDNTFVIATTNNIHKLDQAIVRRPSRFDIIYHFDDPDDIARKELFTRHFGVMPEKELSILVNKTKGFSGAFFKELFILKNVRNISISTAIDEVNKQFSLWEKYKLEAKEMFG